MGNSAIPAPEKPPVSKRKLQSYSLTTHWVVEGDKRLDAGFYANEVFAALTAIEASPYPNRTLADPSVTTEIYWPSRFKRIYTQDPGKGWPFLQASEALMFRPKPEKYIAIGHAPSKVQDYFALPGSIVMTRSGSVGRCRLVTKGLARYFLSDDLLRIAPVIPAGYLYAFLCSALAQPLLTRERYGATVHLEPQHIGKIPIPILPGSQQEAIHKRIQQAYELRDEANGLLDQAEELLYSELGLSKLVQLASPATSTKPNAVTFAVSSRILEGRLDASYHNPVAQAAVAALRKSKYRLRRLGDLAQRIHIPPRFKRIYVERELGIPFLQGSHVPLIKPFDLKFLSRRVHSKLEPWIVEKGWVLITCSGTIGRIALVPTPLHGWAASQHIARVITVHPQAHQGYIAAYLMSQFGQKQLTSKIHGAVVDELTELDIGAIWIPEPPSEVQGKIGDLAVAAFEKKEEANTIEQEAISGLEAVVTNRPRAERNHLPDARN